MKELKYIARLWLALGVLGMFSVVILSTGCKERTFVEDPRFVPYSAPTGVALQGTNYIDIIRVGDTVIVAFTGVGREPPIPTYGEQVKEDGNLTPPQLGGPVKAVGKRPGELQAELQAKYNLKFMNLTVTVKIGDRYYHVDGEIRKPGPVVFLPNTDITTAIAAAGGFTEFANRTVRLTRQNGKSDYVDYNKAIKDPTYCSKYPIYPGDKIYVRRRIL